MNDKTRNVRTVSASTLHLRAFLNRDFLSNLNQVFSASDVISALPDEAKFFNGKEIKNIRPLINTELKKLDVVTMVENHKQNTSDGEVKKLGRSPLYFQLKQ